ncbi:MAG TPA: DNA polymerase III subunit gamma/tau [Saprospiraceae bacterium]|nr:DNA polymerase III subunit gamma/tau [Saprospiraceae bacterium]HMQ85008.1 DNA polymerase III subunit gamma/tau [Saprospiraceae bacterium]
MSHFVVSARKYRPNRFEDVVGQEHVSQTLKNALQTDHLAHAFLFCGPRGVGKTTCARILAKVLNCQNISADYEPCNECESCKAFNVNASFNTIELDAASNNSVEHIRALIEQVRFQPQQGKYKIFIIDEVHMLSQQAFNAFLKTLEEPPPYAVFILATTEKHKIIPTILSRCQIFDFRRIQPADMVAHLESICVQENIKADKDALYVIAQKADGALRDALSIFDRIVSFSGHQITYEDVINNLNILDYDYYFQVVDSIISEDHSKLLLLFDTIMRKGFDPDIFINGLAEHLRQVLVCKDPDTLSLLEVSENLQERYRQQAAIAPTRLILTALNIANDCDLSYRLARNKRLHVEMTLIKMAYINRAFRSRQVPEQEKKTPELNEVATNPASKPIAAAVAPLLTANEPPELPFQKQEQVSEPLEQAEKSKLPESVKPQKHSIAKLGSVSSMLQNIMAEEQLQQGSEVSELSLENIQMAWKAYMDTLEQETIKMHLRNVELRFVEGRIEAIVGSPLAENTIRQELNLMEFLRQKLQAPNLAMTIEIDKSKIATEVPKKKRILSPKETFLQMESVNPNIRALQRAFDLRPEE